METVYVFLKIGPTYFEKNKKVHDREESLTVSWLSNGRLKVYRSVATMYVNMDSGECIASILSKTI